MFSLSINFIVKLSQFYHACVRAGLGLGVQMSDLPFEAFMCIIVAKSVSLTWVSVRVEGMAVE